MRIDILIPCAGDARYVEQTLRSVLSQRHQDWRALVMDNACDHSRYRQVAAATDDSRIRYVRFEARLPATLNWQRCLDLVEADHFGFIHDDDVWASDYLESALGMLADDPGAAAVLTRHFLFSGETFSLESFSPREEDLHKWEMAGRLSAEAFNVIAATASVNHMSSLVCRRKSHGFDAGSRWNPDERFIVPFTVYGGVRLNPASRSFLRWQPSSGTLSFKSRGRACQENLELARSALLAMLPNHPPSESILEELGRVWVSSGYWFRTVQACFSWPLRAELLDFGRSLLRREAIVGQVAGYSAMGRVLAHLPWPAWACAGMAADLEYHLADRRGRRPALKPFATSSKTAMPGSGS